MRFADLAEDAAEENIAPLSETQKDIIRLLVGNGTYRALFLHDEGTACLIFGGEGDAPQLSVELNQDGSIRRLSAVTSDICLSCNR